MPKFSPDQVKKLPHSELSKILDKLRIDLYNNEVVKKKFKEYGVDRNEIYLIPIKFADLPVSARTEHGIIYVNWQLILDGEVSKIDHYLVHEITHYLQQTTGDQPTKGSADDDYLDNEFEQEGFQAQTEYLSDTRDDATAKRYVQKVLDHHEVPEGERDDKEKKLLKLNRLDFLNLMVVCASLSPEQAAKLLNLILPASPAEIGRAFRQLAFQYHPDRNPNPDAVQHFIMLSKARDLLLDPSAHELNNEINYDPANVTEVTQEPWHHQYWTPLSEYSDAERFEYYVNPEIQKQYEKEFNDEQEIHREEAEEQAEVRWQRQVDDFYDASSYILDLLEQKNFSPEKLVDLFGRHRDDTEWMELGLSLNDIGSETALALKDNVGLKHKDEALDAAIIRRLSDDYPEYLKDIMSQDFYSATVRLIKSLGYNLSTSDLINKMPLDHVLELIKKGTLSLVDVMVRTGQDQLFLVQELKNKYLEGLLSTDRSINKLHLVHWLSPESLQFLEKELEQQEISKVRDQALQLISRELNRKVKKASQQLRFDFSSPSEEKSTSKDLIKQIKDFVDNFEEAVTQVPIKPSRHIKKEKLHPLEQSYRMKKLKELLSALPDKKE